MEDLLDAREVAKTLGVSVRRLEQLAKRSEFPELLRIGRGQYRLRRTDYQAWYRAAWTKEREARADLLAEQIRHDLLRRLPPTRVRQ